MTDYELTYVPLNRAKPKRGTTPEAETAHAIHMALQDQRVYNLIFRLYGVVLFLAGESNDMRQQRAALAIRALLAEAMLRNTQIERDFWKQRASRDALVKKQWKQRNAT